MSFLVHDKDVFNKCNKIKTKIKICGNEINTSFYGNKIPEDNEYCAYLSVILLDSIFINADKECFSQIFLEECKYTIKKKNIMNTINEALKLDDSHDNKFDED